MRLIIDYLCDKFDSSEFDRDILQYGLEVLFYNILTITILFILTFLFRNLFFGFIFIPIFAFLRILIGGFHCKTVYGCTSLMITIYCAINIVNGFDIYLNILKYLSIILILLLFSIKQCEKNTLHLKNYDIYYKYVLIIVFTCLYFIFLHSKAFYPIFSALLVVELMYYANVIKERRAKD